MGNKQESDFLCAWSLESLRVITNLNQTVVETDSLGRSGTDPSSVCCIELLKITKFKSKKNQQCFNLQTIPIQIKFGMVKQVEQGPPEQKQCSICLSAIEDQTFVKGCKHEFCLECISQWVRKSKKQCPICRANITALLRQRSSIFNTTLHRKGLRRLQHRLYEEIPVKKIALPDKEPNPQRQAVAFFCFFIIPVSIFMMPVVQPQPPAAWSPLHQ